MTQAPADKTQAAPESSEPFALARRGLPLITRNAAPLRAPWLPPQLCSRAQAVPARASLPPVAPLEQEADDPQWLQPRGVFPQAESRETASVAQASDDEPWWMEAAEWLPADAPPVGQQAIAAAAPQPLAAPAQASYPLDAAQPAASVRSSQTPQAAAPEAKHIPLANTRMGAGTESAAPRQGENHAQAPIMQTAPELLAKPLPQGDEVHAAPRNLAAPSQGPWQIEVRHTEQKHHTERVIERAPSSAALPVAVAVATRNDARAQTDAARQTAAQAEPAIAMQRMGRQAAASAAADAGRSVGERPSMLSDRQTQLAQIQAQTQAAGSGPRIHIDHVQVTVDAPARSAAPVATPAAAASAAAMASAPPTASAAMTAPARAYANAWSSYFARAD